MERLPVDCSTVRSVGYDPGSQTLEIEFRNRFLYEYYGVPENLYHGLLSSGSPLEFHHEHLRDRYQYRRVA